MRKGRVALFWPQKSNSKKYNRVKSIMNPIVSNTYFSNYSITIDISYWKNRYYTIYLRKVAYFVQNKPTVKKGSVENIHCLDY